MDKPAFIADMEQRFGSDRALGVTFRTDKGELLTLDQYDALWEQLGADAMPGTESLLPDGGSAVCCTDYASYIYKQLPGRVEIYGFANENNPTSRVAREMIHPGGHDFAVVDGRYIVDPWPRLVPAVFTQMVFDLQDAADAATVADIYGPQACWERMHLAEHYALTGTFA
jgi:hypothetical protein